ncbi:HAMP domain-containing sensor histidine kinase [Bacillus taeanensis]|uniref:histidine kinase n=1 Tax=Bacillus taeanensis TaxID=273032 RepID=A0A366XYR7_9BACI|nr:histidine kinase dimerization/phospho-acceptor domain-containing protein [Bacillus taeanensis]RBW69071.1 sensor histidine kinase [Bacillus taeanensis]
MAIKWKNKLPIIIFILLVAFSLNGILFTLSHLNSDLHKNYFETMQFDEELNNLINYLTLFEFNVVTPEKAKENITVTEDDIEEHRYRYGALTDQIENLKQQYEGRIQGAIDAGNEEAANTFKKERDAKIADITKNFTSDEHVREKVIKEKEQKIDEYFRELENFRPDLKRYHEAFQYYLKDVKSGEIYTNVNEKSEDKVEQAFTNQKMLFTRNYPNDTNSYLTTTDAYYMYGPTVPEVFDNLPKRSFEGIVALPAAGADFLLENYENYKMKQMVFFSYMIASLLTLITSMIVYKKFPLKEKIQLERVKPYYNLLPIDVRAVSFALAGMILLSVLTYNNHYDFYYYFNMRDFLFHVGIAVLVTAVLLTLLFIQGKLLLDTVKNMDQLKRNWQNSLLLKIYHSLQDVFLNRSVGMQFFLLLTIVFGLGFGAMIVVIEPSVIVFYGLLCLIIGLPTLVILIKRIGYFNRIFLHTTAAAHGHFEQDLPVKGKHTLARLADNVNTLKHGVKSSQKEQAKSERLKTELITNVSHDLRTPLTSIMTYTDLLKTANLENDQRDAYIEIIDRKTKRLKVLIDDLFEASKMASGNIELQKEKVDLVQLLQQALAEYSETINESSLQFRVSNPDPPLYAIVDGQKIWRVFDNLISNILKYSLENTRVYISLKEVNNQAVITFKNVTKYELGDNMDELFERFKRGDTSRHTEGSGLGLAIAKSIIDLHEGNLNIEVDGDLFKVIVILKRV